MICCNRGLMGDFMGPFTGPLVPSQTLPDVSRGAIRRLSGGQAPSGPTYFDHCMSVCVTHAVLAVLCLGVMSIQPRRTVSVLICE